MKPITNVLRQEIKTRIKNGIDISDLLINIDIKGEDLSRAIISKIQIIDGDISGCNFYMCTFGSNSSSSVDVSFIRTKMQNCNFDSSIFLGKAWMRSCDAKNCNFKNANVANVSYEYTDFRNSTFCGAIIKIGTRENLKSIFDVGLLKDLTSSWANKLIIEEQK